MVDAGGHHIPGFQGCDLRELGHQLPYRVGHIAGGEIVARLVVVEEANLDVLRVRDFVGGYEGGSHGGEGVPTLSEKETVAHRAL